MPQTATQPGKRSRKRPIDRLGRWKLEDAKARLSEVVRLAATNGPQLVTIRGKEAAVVLTPSEYEQLLPKSKGHQPLLSFLKGLGLGKIKLDRDKDIGRDAAL